MFHIILWDLGKLPAFNENSLAELYCVCQTYGLGKQNPGVEGLLPHPVSLVSVLSLTGMLGRKWRHLEAKGQGV